MRQGSIGSAIYRITFSVWFSPSSKLNSLFELAFCPKGGDFSGLMSIFLLSIADWKLHSSTTVDQILKNCSPWLCFLINPNHFVVSLSLKRYGGPNPFLVTASLSTAISRNVSQLWLTFTCSDSNWVAIPSSLFTCKSLVNLTLRGDFFVDFPVLVRYGDSV